MPLFFPFVFSIYFPFAFCALCFYYRFLLLSRIVKKREASSDVLKIIQEVFSLRLRFPFLAFASNLKVEIEKIVGSVRTTL